MLGHTNLGLDTGLFYSTRNIMEHCWQADFVHCFAYSLHGGNLNAAEDSVRPLEGRSWTSGCLHHLKCL